MNNIQAALLLGQLARIDDNWKRRKHLWHLYVEKLQKMEGLKLLTAKPSLRHAYHLFTILVDEKKRDEVMLALQEKGIGVAVNYRPIHLLDYYRRAFAHTEGNFPVAEDIGKRTISLPFYPKLSESDVEYVARSVREVLAV